MVFGHASDHVRVGGVVTPRPLVTPVFWVNVVKLKSTLNMLIMDCGIQIPSDCAREGF